MISAALAFPLENNSWVWEGPKVVLLGAHYVSPLAFSLIGVSSTASGFVPCTSLPQSLLSRLVSVVLRGNMVHVFMRISQSTNLCILSNLIINHLGTDLFVFKAKDLMSKWFCEV